MYICGARERGRVWEGGEGGEGESGRGRQGEKRGEEEKGVRRRESNNGEGRERRGKEIWDTVCRVRQRERESADRTVDLHVQCINYPAGKVRVIPRSNADSAEIRNLTRDSAE